MDKMRQLEQALLELGTEIMRLKGEIGDIRSHQDKFLEVINGLKLILDEKGLITTEEFENGIDILNSITGTNYDVSVEDEIEKIKKIHH